MPRKMQKRRRTTIYYVTEWDSAESVYQYVPCTGTGCSCTETQHWFSVHYTAWAALSECSVPEIDADVTDNAKEEVAEDEKEAFQKTVDSLTATFRKELGNDKLDVKVEKLKDSNVASIMTLSEQSRRMQEMMKMYGMDSMGMDMGGENTLILNANHPLVQYVQKHEDGENTSLICKQLYDLAMLAHKPLNPEEMTAFVKRSNDIMMLLTK